MLKSSGSCRALQARSYEISGTLARLSRVEWDFDVEGPKVQTEFASFVNSVIIDVHRRREEEEITILKE